MLMFDFSSLKKSVQSVADQVKQLRKRIEDLKRQREDIETAPAAKSDIKALVEAWVQSKAVQHQKALRAMLDPFVRKPAKADDVGHVNQYMTLLGAVSGQNQIADTRSMDAVICGLFGPQILQGLSRSLDALDWPNEGLPMVQRRVALEKLDEEIAALTEEEQALTESARLAGVIVE